MCQLSSTSWSTPEEAEAALPPGRSHYVEYYLGAYHVLPYVAPTFFSRKPARADDDAYLVSPRL